MWPKKYPGEIKATEQYIVSLKADAEAVVAIPALDKEHFSMTVNGTVYTEYKEAGEAIINAATAMRAAGVDGEIGEYHGFSMKAEFVMLTQKYTLILQNNGGWHYVELGKDPTGNITRINHALTSIGEKLLPEAEQKLENLRQQMQNAQEELKKPFPKEQELAEKSARLAELNALLNMDQKDSMDAVGVGEKTVPAVPVSSGGKNQPAAAGDVPGSGETGQAYGWQPNQGSQRCQGNSESHNNPNSYSNPDRYSGHGSQYGQKQAQSRFRNTKPKMYSYR